MAATSTAFAVATGSAALTSIGDASRLSSGNAFQTTSVVQVAPLSSKRSSRVVAARASLSEDSKSTGRDVVVSMLAAGAALGLTVSVVDGAFANPIDVAKSKAKTSFNSAKDAAADLPSAPSPGGAVEEAKKGAGNIAEGIKGPSDGFFAKLKSGPLKKSEKVVASTNGGTGSAIGDAEKRISEFGKNPFADNLNEGSKRVENAVAQAKTPKPNEERVGEATKKVEGIASDLETKGKDAIGESKSLFGNQAQGNLPSFPNLIPQLPDAPQLPTPDAGSGLKDLKSGVESKVESAKSAAGSVLPQ